MAKRSATETIKSLNPKNVSGTIPQGLDMIKQLQQVKGNPKMIEAVGMQNLQGMFQFLQQLFVDKKKPKEKKTQQELDEEAQYQSQIDDLQNSINTANTTPIST